MPSLPFIKANLLGSKIVAWECGGWHSESNNGTSTIIGGLKGEQLQVVYERKQSVRQKTNSHRTCTLPLSPQSYVVAAYVYPTEDTETFHVNIFVYKITDITWIRDGAKATVQASEEWMKSCTVYKEEISSLSLVGKDILNEDPEINNNIKCMIVNAVKKAMTPKCNQKVFWGKI